MCIRDETRIIEMVSFSMGRNFLSALDVCAVHSFNRTLAWSFISPIIVVAHCWYINSLRFFSRCPNYVYHKTTADTSYYVEKKIASEVRR